jgi:hypothetical protein
MVCSAKQQTSQPEAGRTIPKDPADASVMVACSLLLAPHIGAMMSFRVTSCDCYAWFLPCRRPLCSQAAVQGSGAAFQTLAVVGRRYRWAPAQQQGLGLCTAPYSLGWTLPMRLGTAGIMPSLQQAWALHHKVRRNRPKVSAQL